MIERTTVITAQITGITKFVTNDVETVIDNPEQSEYYKKCIAKHLKDNFDADDVIVTVQDFINDEVKEDDIL
ncbi:MAG: hypothetical protein J5617_03740 [Bacilli bacterium]|nr:hypothetical protein [Bacilli bacterium]